MVDLTRIPEHRTKINGYDLELLADVPVVYHCHHFNLFWDQTIDDALGIDLGTVIRTRAAREAFHDILSTLCGRLGADTPADRKTLAEGLFAAMGHGSIALDTRDDVGTASGEFLHYGYAWNEKYGAKIRRRRPADAVAAGYSAAAMEVIHGLPRESVDAKEDACIAMRDRACHFDLRSGDQTPLMRSVRRPEIERALGNSMTSRDESHIAGVAAGLRDFAATISGDERGLVQAFGLFVAMHATTYYNRSAYDALRHIGRTAPQSSNVMKALLREAGHVCAFNTFGGILLSPEWEGMVGPLRGNVEEIVSGACAIGRALGMGRWCIEELVPHSRLVIRFPATYESTYYVNREGRAEEGSCYFMQGATLATMQLAHRVPWTSRPALTQEFYGELFRGGVPWRVEETRCVSKGDEMCEFAITAADASAENRLTL